MASRDPRAKVYEIREYVSDGQTPNPVSFRRVTTRSVRHIRRRKFVLHEKVDQS